MKQNYDTLKPISLTSNIMTLFITRSRFQLNAQSFNAAEKEMSQNREEMKTELTVTTCAAAAGCRQLTRSRSLARGEAGKAQRRPAPPRG